MNACIPYACLILTELEEAIGSPGSRVTDDGELPGEGWESNLGP